jgi:hypothetical protein
MKELYYVKEGLRLTIYVCVLFVGDGSNRRSRCITRQLVGL